MRRVLSLFLYLSIAALAGCGSKIDTFPTLSDQGVLPLSTTNAYLGPNIFLSKELEKSQYLFNFFKSRGAPTAIEIIQPTFKSTRVLMYYPSSREVYAADLMVSGTKREWIVRGPFSIERNDYRDLAKLQTSLVGEPIFIIWGKEYRFRFQKREGQPIVKAKVPEYTVPAKPKPKTTKTTTTSTEQVPAKGPVVAIEKPAGPLTSDQEALFIAKGLAPKDSAGNLTHPVRSGQSLEQIAEWYTGSASNAAELAAASGLQQGAPVRSGTKVKIPAKLVKQTKLLAQ